MSARSSMIFGALAHIPLVAYGILIGLVWLACRQVGHWPIIKGPDPISVWIFFPGDGAGMIMWLTVMAAIPASWMAMFFLLVHIADTLAKSRLAIDGRTAAAFAWRFTVCALGLMLFSGETRRMMYWLLD